jgi:Tripartite tricarboxylate transporter TctB family
MNIRASKDFWAGIMFLSFAAVAVMAARGYAMGTAGRMGPGYFPMTLGLVLGLLGLLIIVRSVIAGSGAITGLQLRPLLVLAGAAVMFGLLIERLGLVITLVLVVAASAAASRQSRPLEVAALAAALAAFSVGIFVYALRLPLSIWPTTP